MRLPLLTENEWDSKGIKYKQYKLANKCLCFWLNCSLAPLLFQHFTRLYSHPLLHLSFHHPLSHTNVEKQRDAVRQDCWTRDSSGPKMFPERSNVKQRNLDQAHRCLALVQRLASHFIITEDSKVSIIQTGWSWEALFYSYTSLWFLKGFDNVFWLGVQIYSININIQYSVLNYTVLYWDPPLFKICSGERKWFAQHWKEKLLVCFL